MNLPPDAIAGGARPGWVGYVAVPDVDAKAAEAAAAGGCICHPPADIPQVGRFATVADPHGAVLCLFHGSGSDEAPASDPGAPGHIGWNELMTDDLDAAWRYHAGLFGWVRDEAIDMGPMGTYQLFAPAAGLPPVGGMMQRPPQVPTTCWLHYFNVDALDAAVGRVRDGGGQAPGTPMQVPGGSWVMPCVDPQGAAFALVGRQR
jgi:predicted enzyme related to lactoylglutathione lyase